MYMFIISRAIVLRAGGLKVLASAGEAGESKNIDSGRERIQKMHFKTIM